nr:BTAD domain-containing putative transcriptional regulator [Caldilineaceae bacterium]
MRLVLRLFGAVQTTWNGISIKFATEHTRALFAYLAVEADLVHQRTTLAALFWPEEAEARARHNLRQALFFLKQAMNALPEREAILHVTPTTLQWNSQGVEVDLSAFQQYWRLTQTHNHAHIEQCPSCLESFAKAVALYQGEFLHGLLLKANQPFEEWALFVREQCHHQAVTMLDTLIAHHLTQGAYDQAERYATRQVTLEPWHEEGHRQLMRALAAQGHQGAALRQYESCRRMLQQELGVPPSLETTRLYEQIRAGEFDKATRWQADQMDEAAGQAVSLSSSHPGELAVARSAQPPKNTVTGSPPHNLPANLAPLVGRSQQLERLRSLLGNPTQRLLTIVGMGGMGKGRLALALLEQLLAEAPAPFAHGVWFVPMIGVLPGADGLPEALAGAILKALEIIPPTQEALQSTLFHYLAQRHLLLLFDSFEHLLVEEAVATAATDFILALLHAAPEVTLVVTSRLPLQLLAEAVLRLDGLPVPPGLTPKLDRRDLANYDSIRLFVYHAQRTLPGFSLGDDQLAAVVELCRTLSGMPLAIELAAALAPHFTPGEMVTAIRQNLDLLVSRRRDLDARHRQFRAVLESSWQLLSVRERGVLAQCSVFVGRFSRAAAQAVTGATVSELASLVDKALIQQPGVGVYQLHDLLRQFAADQLQADDGEAMAVADRHSAYYLNFVALREQMLTRRQPRQAVEEIQNEVDNVRQAWGWAVMHIAQSPLTATICARLAASAYGLWHFYLIAGLCAEGVAVFEQAVAGVQAALSTLPSAQASEERADEVIRYWQHLLSKLLALEAYMLCAHGNYGLAPAVARQAIAVGAACGSNEGEVIGLLALAQAHYHTGAPGEAKTYAEQTLQRVHQLAWAKELPEAYYDVQWLAYLYLGAIALYADDDQQAKTQITKALELCRLLGKLRGEMHARLNLANLARYKQDYAAARPEYQQALQIACELGYRRGEAVVRYELADVMRGRGEYAPALAQFEQALAILHEIGELSHENYAQADVG